MSCDCRASDDAWRCLRLRYPRYPRRPISVAAMFQRDVREEDEERETARLEDEATGIERELPTCSCTCHDVSAPT